MDDIRVASAIKIRVDRRQGSLVSEEIVSSMVQRLEAVFALSENLLYQVIRIPRPQAAEKGIVGEDVFSDLEKLGIARQGPLYLTASQSDILGQLIGMAELCGADQTYGGVRLRNRPLISGLSGSGKTALIGHLCDRLSAIHKAACPLLRITAGSWTLHGARSEPQTLLVIISEQDYLLAQGYLALFTRFYAQLGRMLRAVQHICTVRSEGSSS